MHQQKSDAPIYVALALAILAAVTSLPAQGGGLEAKLHWALTTERAASEAPSIDMDELTALGVP